MPSVVLDLKSCGSQLFTALFGPLYVWGGFASGLILVVVRFWPERAAARMRGLDVLSAALFAAYLVGVPVAFEVDWPCYWFLLTVDMPVTLLLVSSGSAWVALFWLLARRKGKSW